MSSTDHTSWENLLAESEKLCAEAKQLREEGQQLIIKSRNLRTILTLSMPDYDKRKQEWAKLSLPSLFRIKPSSHAESVPHSKLGIL